MTKLPLVVTQSDCTYQLLLLFVAYHPSALEISRLKHCLEQLSSSVAYAVVVNDYKLGEPVEELAINAKFFLVNTKNLGYGRAVNQLTRRIGSLPPLIAVLNTDLTWASGTFENLSNWLLNHPEVALAVPQILDEMGCIQKLCKHNPTFLALISRRFIPNCLKPPLLRGYDSWFVMDYQNYFKPFEAPYLSGCCMLIRSAAYLNVDGFDERFFLYLEDADLTRRLSRHGQCIHLPIASVVHCWGRGSYRNFYLTLVNIMSLWIYARKWGLKLW